MLFPLQDRGRSTQIGHGRLASSLIRCTTGLPHRKYQKGRRTIPKACPEAYSCNAVTAVSLSSKGGKWRFLTADSGVDPKEKW